MLATAGYTRQDPVDEPGEFCVRGGVVDFYPAGANQPLRLEFVGDTVESIRAYDPSTQRSTGALDQIGDRAAGRVDRRRERRAGQKRDDSRVHSRSRPAGGPAVRARRGSGERRQAHAADSRQLRRGHRERNAGALPGAFDRRVELHRTMAAWRHDARDARSRRRRGANAATHRQSAGARVRRPHSGMDRRNSPNPRARRHHRLRGAHGGARRAHDRAACGLRGPCRSDRAGRGRPHGIRPGRYRPPVARLPAPGSRSPALGRNRRLRGRAKGPRATPFGHPHVPVRLPRSQGRRSRRARRPWHRHTSSA